MINFLMVYIGVYRIIITAMKISILSDTHGFIDDQILRLLADSDAIWHAGDIGNLEVFDTLSTLPGRLRAVTGNIDGAEVKLVAPEFDAFNIDGCTIGLIHIAGNPSSYNQKVRALIARFRPHILVAGHSHILKVKYDKKNNLLFINPGACGHHGIHKVRTIVQFELIDGKPTNMNVIELGNRGKIS